MRTIELALIILIFGLLYSSWRLREAEEKIQELIAEVQLMDAKIVRIENGNRRRDDHD